MLYSPGPMRMYLRTSCVSCSLEESAASARILLGLVPFCRTSSDWLIAQEEPARAQRPAVARACRSRAARAHARGAVGRCQLPPARPASARPRVAAAARPTTPLPTRTAQQQLDLSQHPQQDVASQSPVSPRTAHSSNYPSSQRASKGVAPVQPQPAACSNYASPDARARRGPVQPAPSLCRALPPSRGLSCFLQRAAPRPSRPWRGARHSGGPALAAGPRPAARF
jgi:hypothetical protein